MLCSNDSRILEDSVPTASACKMCSLESNIGRSRNARWMTRERITLHNNVYDPFKSYGHFEEIVKFW